MGNRHQNVQTGFISFDRPLTKQGFEANRAWTNPVGKSRKSAINYRVETTARFHHLWSMGGKVAVKSKHVLFAWSRRRWAKLFLVNLLYYSAWVEDSSPWLGNLKPLCRRRNASFSQFPECGNRIWIQYSQHACGAFLDRTLLYHEIFSFHRRSVSPVHS